MIEIPSDTGLILSTSLFIIGLAGVLIRRNIIFLLMSIEIMLNSAGLAFIFAGSFHNAAEGQIMFIFILTLAAAEVSIGLALALTVFRQNNSLDIDKLNNMKG